MTACRSLVDKAKEWREDLVGVKLDVSQAFDRIHRHALLRVLQPAYHDAPHEVLAVAEVLAQSDVHFSVAGEGWVCPMARGIVQGGTLSASLFSLAVDDLCHRLQQRWQHQGRQAPLNVERVKQWMWAYADDLVLFSRSVSQLSQLLADVRRELREMGLEINAGKTQVIAAPWTAMPGSRVQLDGGAFTVVNRITYLGLPLGFEVSNADMGAALLARAWRAFFQYRPVLCHRGVCVDRRLALLNTYVTSTWSWAACHCRPTASLVQSFRTAWLSMVTAIVGFSRDDANLQWAQDFTARRRASRLYARLLGLQDWGDLLVSRMFAWWGHVARMTADRSRPAAMALHYRGMRQWRAMQRDPNNVVVHPMRGTWPSPDRALQEFVESEVAASADWIALAQDRVGWKTLLSAWHHKWKQAESDISLHGRSLVLPQQAGENVWLTRAGESVPSRGSAASGPTYLNSSEECPGWQIAVDGSWGLTASQEGKVASWGLILWNDTLPPHEWVAMGGRVDPGETGHNGSARAELEALRVACHYRVCPPLMLSDEAAHAFLVTKLITTDSLWALNVITGNFWSKQHVDVAIEARRVWNQISDCVRLAHVRGHAGHVGNCWAHTCAERARLSGPFACLGVPSRRPADNDPFQDWH